VSVFPTSRRRALRSSSLLVLMLASGTAMAQQTIQGGNDLPAVVVAPPRPAAASTPNLAASSPAPRAARRGRNRRAAQRPAPATAPVVAPAIPAQAASPGSVAISPTGNPVPLDRVASSVTVITAEDLAREQRRTVPDALQRVPGLNVVQAGGPGGQTSVFLRGSNSNHVKVLVDGIEVTDPSTPNRIFDFGQLLTNDIARIEVLRGPQSGFYGSDAIGGVISIVTKKGEGPAKLSVTAEGGSYGTFNQSGTLSGSVDRFNYAFSVGHYRSESVPVTPRELVPLGWRINPNAYDNRTFSTKLGYDFNEYFSLNYVGRMTDSSLRFTGDNSFPAQYNFQSFPDQARSGVDNLFQYHRAEAVINLLDGRFRNVFGVGYTNAYTTNRGPGITPDTTPANPTHGIGIRTRYDYRGDVLIVDGQRLVFGVQRDEESFSNKSINPKTGNTGAYVQLQQQFFERVFLTSNLRYDDNDAFGSHMTYRVAPAVILPWTETKLKASVGTGFKAPTLSQLYQDYPAFGFFANPNLRPEKSTGWDAGFEQPLFDNRIRFGATYFENEFKNLINSVATGPFTSTLENVGRARTYGAETFLDIAATDTLSFKLTYTNTATKDEDKRQELLRRPRHKATGLVEWRPLERLTLSGTVIYIGPQVDANRDFSIPRLRTDPYAIVNLAATYKVTDYLDVFARVDNVFDKRVQDPTGFLRPGLSAYGGVRLTSW
jgi:vitamin B12 transporter